MVTFLEWHKLAARAQDLARSALEMLRHPGAKTKAKADAQSMLDQLVKMGFSPSDSPARRADGDGKG